MRILILGGIGEALYLAKSISTAHNVFYSIAGIISQSPVVKDGIQMHIGGFGGCSGLITFLYDHYIELLIDATHPFSMQISAHAQRAALITGCQIWTYLRPAWTTDSDLWQHVSTWAEILNYLHCYSRPFFTLGRKPIKYYYKILPNQIWLVRCMTVPIMSCLRLKVLCSRGPFSFEQELNLMRQAEIDILVTKNSGGNVGMSKLLAAKELGIKVMILERPVQQPSLGYITNNIQHIIDQLL